MKRTVLQMLEEASHKYPTQPYVSQKIGEGEGTWQSWSFSDVDRESTLFAAALIKLGYGVGDSIALLSEGRFNWVISEFGVLKARCASVPLSSKLKEAEIPFRINHSDSKAIILSEYTLERVTALLDQLDHLPLLIVLSHDTDLTERMVAQYSLKKGIDYLEYDDFISLGLKSMEEVKGELNTRISEVDEEDTVTISYTSGTTGNPKGIMLTHKNYWVNSHDAVEIVDMPEGAGSLIILPLDHSFAHTVGIYISLLKGLSMSFIDYRGGGMAPLRNISSNLKETNSYFLLTVPALSGNFMKKMDEAMGSKGVLIQSIYRNGLRWGIIMGGNGYNRTSLWLKIAGFIPYKIASLLIFPKLREVFGSSIAFCVGGGALLEIKQQEFYRTIGLPIYQGYGLTEASPIISANSPSKCKLGTSGVIFPSITCKIMGNIDTQVPEGVVGEIVIKGDNVMKGYYKNPQATSETLREGWLWTGDLGYMDRDGFLVVTGRAKALLISADGEKYSPEEIEEAILNTSNLVNQVMVYNDMKKYTTGLVTLNGDNIMKLIKEKNITTEEELLNEINQSLFSFVKEERVAKQWIPSTLALIDEPFSEENGLINSTMKLVRHKVVEKYKDRIEGLYEGEEGTDFFSQKNKDAVKVYLKG